MLLRQGLVVRVRLHAVALTLMMQAAHTAENSIDATSEELEGRIITGKKL
jgi:hypothetical protein